jgi:hypothetical protein
MSMLLPTQGQLPAAVALAIAAASPGAAHSEGGCLEVRAPGADRPDSLKAIRDSLDRDSFRLLAWVAEMQVSLDDATASFADIGQLVGQRAARLNKGVALVAAWANARIADMDGVASDVAHSVDDAISAGRLTAFALRAGAKMPQTLPASAVAGAQAAVHATLQPLYDALQQVRVVEARLVLSARRAALKADMQAMAKRNLETIRLAKAEFLRVVAETARLAFAEIPPREARAVAREAVLTIPADAAGPKPFGKRINYQGLAKRWVATP